jgi:hypothetical protein
MPAWHNNYGLEQPKQAFLGKPTNGLLRPFVLSQILVGKPWDTFPESASRWPPASAAIISAIAALRLMLARHLQAASGN